MLLSELLHAAGLDHADVIGDRNVVIRSIATDSRQVTPDALFVAVPGERHNGAQFVPMALQKGAAALLIAERVRLDMPATVPVVRVEKVRAAVAKLAASFYAPQPEYVVAVTGTDGKTSVVNFARQLFALQNASAASIGTLGLMSPSKMLNQAFPKVNTSPEPVLLHKTLLSLAAKQVRYVAIEASSHGLAQHRLDGVRFKAAAFTNLTRDHLDYHGSEEAYFEAKARLFSEVMEEASVAVIHADDARAGTLAQIARRRGLHVKTYGKAEHADYRIVAVEALANGLHATITVKNTQYTFDLPLYGAFQLENMLAALGLVSACGFDEEALIASLPKLVAVKGRMEKAAELANGACCFVDYAHTPAALEKLLVTLRAHAKGRVHVVFGCGGERDIGKRPQMGAIASRLADDVTVTDDNPRGEDAGMIRRAILASAPQAEEIADREAAIQAAVQKLQPGDVLVVAGKGHEDYQLIGEHKHAFDDAQTIKKAVGML